MKLLTTCAVLSAATLTLASDHNNVDKERPLRFDDAYSIAFGGFEFQNGIRSRQKQTEFRSELQWGFAKNRDLSLGLETENGESLFRVRELSYFHGVRREIGSQPAFGYRVDLESVSDATGLQGRVRGILTKALRQYDKLHLNVDVEFQPGLRNATLGGVLGYSVPLGYPKHFDQTLLAEVGSSRSGSWVGVGLRRQLSATGVLDVGWQSGGAVTVGYSFSF